MAEKSCYHCGLPVLGGSHYQVLIQGEPRDMCCPGCQAVATAIVDGGLDRFYQYRTAESAKPDKEHSEKLRFYDLPEIQEDFVRTEQGGDKSADFVVKGITCSACAWLIEKHLLHVKGVVAATVNVANHRCHLRWDPGSVRLSDILLALETIGYEARPASDTAADALRNDENRHFLLRLGVAGVAMMQAGMAAVALYAGGFYGIDQEWETLLRWVSLVMATPVVLYSARPFFTAAIRSIRVRHLVMDVPVSIAISLAYGASIWATLSESGEVYFDSVSMFTFFLLLGRYLEMRARHRNEQQATAFSQLLPAVATLLAGDGDRVVPVKSLKNGDTIRVGCGETIPCDGEVIDGDSEVIEAVLTGEELPVIKHQGLAVSAGTVNVVNPLLIRVQSTGGNTRLAKILNLVASAEGDKPPRAILADKVAAWFVAALLVISVTVAVSWYYIDPSRALWVTLSVLVVTCPCALSLATPAALTVATGLLRQQGLLIRKGHVLERLSTVDHCIFDKTGTLTLGNMKILAVIPLADVSEQFILTTVSTLEQGSTHPIAKAFRRTVGIDQAQKVNFMVGQGVTGTIAGKAYVFGRADFVCRQSGLPIPAFPSDSGLLLLLASDEGLLGWVQLEDELRPGARDALTSLDQLGVSAELLSGDRQQSVDAMAAHLGFRHAIGQATPQDKLARIQSLQQEGHQVMMVGDGINDVPVLSAADVSVAMGDAADLTRLHADSILVTGNLLVLARAVYLARQTRRIIRQNLSWALAYNLVALPLACAGLVPPWAAAIGMSGSSLLVVANALRLNRCVLPENKSEVRA